MKICSKCKEEKAFEAFGKDKARSDGLSPYCGLCRSALRKRDSHRISEYNKTYSLTLTEVQIENKKRLDRERYYSQTAGKRQLEKIRKAAYKKANPHKGAAYAAKRRAVIKRAMPSWANEEAIALLYKQAEELSKATGIAHHVDHIVPLNSNIVCGLHWEGNMNVIPAKENISKNNRHWPNMP